MSFASALRVALGSLLVHKGRSVLTCLGIVIGIGAVIAMVSAGGGARRELDDRLQSVGKNLIVVRAGARLAAGAVTDFAPLTREDAAAIRREVGPLLTGVAEFQITQQLASSREHNWSTVVTGTTPELCTVREWPLQYGRSFDEDDLKKRAPVCLLGQTVRQHLFPDRPDPVGESFRVGGLQLRVLGVLTAKGRSPIGADQDDEIFLPLTTLQHKLAGEERIGLILAAVRSENNLERAKEEITRVLRREHRLRANQPDNFDASSVAEMAAIAEVFGATLQGLVALIASVSLVVGGIGIMNIMLVSVTERTREIGIRLAIGARPTDILLQFLAEAVVLALLGGLIGITVGVGAAAAAARLAGWPLVVSPALVLLASLLSASVGVFAGFYPAWRASRLDPIQALRYE